MGSHLVVDFGLHGGEKQNLLNGVGVGQEHGNTVNTAAPTTGGRQTVLKSLTEGLVNELGLVVTLVLLAGLLLESGSLVKGIVQLSVSIANLLGSNKDLETLAKTGDVSVVLGQRRHHLGVAENEGGVDAGVLKVLTNKLVEHTGVGQRRRADQVVVLENLLQELVGLVAVKIVTRGELNIETLLQGSDHIQTLPRSAEINLHGLALGAIGVVLNLVTAGDLLDHLREKQLSGLHEVVHISVGLVELTGGELGVVGLINTLVSELTSNLVNSLKTTDNQLLEVKLGSNSHKQIHVQIVMVGNEGLGSGTTSNQVHHGGLNLNKVSGVKVLADVRNDLRSGNEAITGRVVHDQIKVSLSVSRLKILETVVLSREHVQGGGQELDRLNKDRELTLTTLLGSGAEGVTGNTDNVTTSQEIMDRVELLLAKGLGDNLNLLALTVENVKLELSTRLTLGENTASDRDLLVLELVTALKVGVLLNKLINANRDVELVGVGVGFLVVLSSLIWRDLISKYWLGVSSSSLAFLEATGAGFLAAFSAFFLATSLAF